MKSFCIFIIFTFSFMNTSIFADDSIFDQLTKVRAKIKEHFIGAPPLSKIQKLKIMRILKKHRPQLRQEVKNVRNVALPARKEARNLLTRDQLLMIMDLQDEFFLRAPGEVLAGFLKKWDKTERIELLKTMRRLWRGNKSNIGDNLEALFLFIDTKVAPKVIKKFAVTEEQVLKLKQIRDRERQKVKPLLIKLIGHLYDIRVEVRGVLDAEQNAFIDTNRDKIFQKVLEFVENL